jgi:hypothetical protein
MAHGQAAIGRGGADQVDNAPRGKQAPSPSGSIIQTKIRNQSRSGDSRECQPDSAIS